MKHSTRKILCLMLGVVWLAMLLPGIACADEEIHIIILATSDLHGKVLGYNYEDDAKTDNNGMARLYSFICQVREENPIVFLADAGDAIQGTVLTDDIANRNPDRDHPVIAAMNMMGYDAMTLGNHEFDWGVEVPKKIANQAAFPVLGMNVLNRDGSFLTGCGWTIVEHGGVRLAVIGVCTPDVPIWDGDKEGVDETIFTAGNTAVRKAVEEIGDRADIILVSAHMGLYAEFDQEGGSDAGEKILEDNPEVDILQVAHMHITENERIREVPVVGVRNSGREIARIDVTLDRNRKIRNISTEIIDMAGVEPSSEICGLPAVQKAHGEAVILARSGNGEDDDPGAYLGTSTARFQPVNEIKGLPEGRLRDTPVIDLILKVELLCSDADVAACSLFKDTGDLPEGPVYFADILNIYEFDNTLVTLEITGRELKNYMEWSAECYHQWTPGDINISFDPDYPGYLHDMFGGIEYEINLSRPKGERIENVRFRGKPLRDDQILKLAVNNYRYSSAIRALHLVEGRPDWESSQPIRDMIADYFSSHSPVAPTVDNNWKITGVDLCADNPLRGEIISYINEGLLPTPYHKSYNLADYDELVSEAEIDRNPMD